MEGARIIRDDMDVLHECIAKMFARIRKNDL